MVDLLLNRNILLGFRTCDVVYYCYTGSIFIVTSLVCWLLYNYLRPKFPSFVNCWFCNKNTLVSWKLRNGWDCPFCEQYNGFTPDGDYNTDVHKRFVRNRTNSGSNNYLEPTNGLCRLCNINQQLKVQQLARFTPMNEDNYDEEIEHFRRQLEKSYKLCNSCEQTLAQTLERQKYSLLTDRLNSRAPAPHVRDAPPFRNRFRDFQKILKLSAFAMFSSLTVVVAVDMYTSIFEDQPLPIVHNILFEWRGLFSGIFLLYLCSLYRNNRGMWDNITIGFWLITEIASLTGYKSFLLVLCIATITVFSRSFKGSSYLTSKKSHTHEVDRSLINNCATMRRTDSPVTVTPLMPKTDHSLKFGHVKNQNHMNAVKNKENPEISKVQTRSQSLKSKSNQPLPDLLKVSSVSSAPDPQKETFEAVRSTRAKSPEVMVEHVRPRFRSPPPEVYDKLNGLHLSSPGEKTEKSSGNFLTEPFTWNKKETKVSSLIKPAKFVPYQSAVEEDDRSSTPSSSAGSTQEPFSKALSPVYSKFSPPQCNRLGSAPFYDYNQTFIHTSPYATPFHLGPTAVFTYSPYTPYPYGFPQKSFTPPYDYSGMSSPRFSDVNSTAGTENLWESYQASTRWSTLKRVLFTSSVIFNVCSIVVFLISSHFYS